MGILATTASPQTHADGVILLHGIARSSKSMRKLETALHAEGYTVLNLDYPSRQEDLASIAETIHPAITAFQQNISGNLHFVTHSMGGLVVRVYLKQHRPANLGKVVMLAPPNQGSEVADFLHTNLLYRYFFGPAGQQLTTAAALTSPADYPTGILAGTRSWYLPSSWWLLPGEDDGRVTVKRTHLTGETDHTGIAAPHPTIMNHPEAISKTLQFLKTGHFHPAPEEPVPTSSP